MNWTSKGPQIYGRDGPLDFSLSRSINLMNWTSKGPQIYGRGGPLDFSLSRSINLQSSVHRRRCDKPESKKINIIKK